MVIQGNEGMELGHNSRPLSSSFSFFAPFIRLLTQHIGVWLKNQKVTAHVEIEKKKCTMLAFYCPFLDFSRGIIVDEAQS